MKLLLASLTLLSTAPLIHAWKPPSSYELKISSNGQFLQTTSGDPFFWQADTAWLLTHRLNYTETETYLSDRASKGYNVVLNVGFTQIGIDSPNRYGDLPYIDEDLSRPNEPYWEYIDSIVELAWTKHKIRMAMIPAWNNYVMDGLEPGLITAKNGEAFGNFIGRRYPFLPKFLFADTNPFWADQTAITADYAAGGIPGSHPIVDFSAAYDAVAAGIVAGERAVTGRSHRWWPLLTMHPRNQWISGAPVALASANLGDRDYLTFDAAQSGHVDIIPHAPTPWWNARRGYETVEVMWATATSKHGKPRPVLDNEPHYEARWARKETFEMPWNASDVRTGSWQTALCGAAGVTYGNDNVMQMYDPEFVDTPNSGVTNPWYKAIDDAGAAQVQYITKAFLDRGEKGFFNRVPAQDIIVGDAGKTPGNLSLARKQ